MIKDMNTLTWNTSSSTTPMTLTTPTSHSSDSATKGQTLNTPKPHKWSQASYGIHSTRTCLQYPSGPMNMNRRILAMSTYTHSKTTNIRNKRLPHTLEWCVWTSTSTSHTCCASGVRMVQSWFRISEINSANLNTGQVWRVASTTTLSGRSSGILTRMLRISRQYPVMANYAHGG